MNISLEVPITDKQLANLEKEALKYAIELFTMHESKKHALITIEELLKLKKSLYFSKVKTILEKM